jgi:two-component system, chemotaxis family, sensor histidine kinase and response regulator WspE
MGDLSQFSLLELFHLEVTTQVAVLNKELLALEGARSAFGADSAPMAPDLAALMRAAHSIKGAARIVQIDAAVALAHAMEDCLIAAQAEMLNADAIDVLLRGSDLLLEIAQKSLAHPDHPCTLEDPVLQGIIADISKLPTNQIDAKDSSKLDQISLADAQEYSPPKFLTYSVSEPNSTSAQSPPLVENFGGQPEPTPAQRDIRVSVRNLNRLMGLAGESLVEANWLQPFSDSLLKLKSHQVELSRLLANLQELLKDSTDPRLIEGCHAVSQKANTCRQHLQARQTELELYAQRSANLAERLYRQVLATHMRPFGDSGQGFPRMVRDLGRQLGKQVKLELIGQSTLVDRDILEKLEAPLTHILRNAIDHGIELPQQRRASGKPDQGTIRVEAVQRAGMLFVTVADDGQGIDLEKLRQIVIERQLTPSDLAARLSEAELLDFLFLPGFSTASSVTEISGRGVGLDVAHSMVQAVGGVLRVSTKLGEGTQIQMQLPLTLSVIRALLVEIAGESYAFPLSRIDQVVQLSPTALAVAENRPFFDLDGQAIGLVLAHQVLELSGAMQPPLSPLLSTVVISDRLSRYGLVVDRFLGEQSLVVRPLDPRLGKVPNISAAALMDDGSPLLIVDVEDLVRSIDKQLNSGSFGVFASASPAARPNKRILVVDDSITVREMERKLLQNHGYQVDVAVNGMDGWNAARSDSYDLIVTDIDMPRMNGFELVEQIKSSPNLKQIPVIIVSYKDRPNDRLQGLEAGADYYLTKSSFHDDTLLQAVIDLIGD